MKQFRLQVTEVGPYGTFILPLPKATLEALGWKDGDQIKPEIVVLRSGKADYIVLEKVEKPDA